jgi:nitrogen regulatory protein PII
MDFDAFFTPEGSLFIPFLRWFLYHARHTNEEAEMKHITTILKESEVMAVRKAVCIAGAECVVIRPVKQALYAVEPWQGQSNLSPQKSRVLLDVTTDDRHYGGIVSAIKKMLRVGKIDLASRDSLLLSGAV